MMLLCAGLTALITVNGSVAALVPVVVVMAVRLRRAPSQLLMPARVRRPRRLAPRPHRVAGQRDRLRGGRRRGGRPDRVLRVRARRDPAPRRHDRDRRAARRAAAARTGRRGRCRRTSARTRAPSSHQYGLDEPEALLTRAHGRGRGRDPAALRAGRPDGLPRDGHRQRRPRRAAPCSARARSSPGETTLAVGDTLLLQGTWGALDEHLDDPDVIVVDEPALVRRQAVPLGPGARRALVVLAGDGRRCSRRGRCHRRWRACWRRGRSSSRACSRSSRPTAASGGRR